MALSMLGLRVRAFDGDEAPMHERELKEVLRTFDALVDAPIVPAALAAAAADEHSVILLEADAPTPAGLEPDRLPPLRSAIVAPATIPGADRGKSCAAYWDLSSPSKRSRLELREPSAYSETNARPDGSGLLRGYGGTAARWTIRHGSCRRGADGSRC